LSNIEIVPASGNRPVHEIVHEKSHHAGLTIIGFREEHIKNRGTNYFHDFARLEDVLFVKASQAKKIVDREDRLWLSAQRGHHHSFYGVHTVFGLVEYNTVGPLDNFIRNFVTTICG